MMKGKKWKHLIMGVTAVLTVGIIAGCGGGGGQKKTEDGKKMYKVGIVQLVEHNALDAANKGFVDGLKKRGYEEGKNIEISARMRRPTSRTLRTFPSGSSPINRT